MGRRREKRHRFPRGDAREAHATLPLRRRNGRKGLRDDDTRRTAFDVSRPAARFAGVVDDDADARLLHRIALKTHRHPCLLSQGAEARVFSTTFLEETVRGQTKVQEKYRHPVLDEKLTRSRLLAECRSLMKAGILGVQAPTVLFVDKSSASIFMERIEGSLERGFEIDLKEEEEEEKDQKLTMDYRRRRRRRRNQRPP